MRASRLGASGVVILSFVMLTASFDAGAVTAARGTTARRLDAASGPKRPLARDRVARHAFVPGQVLVRFAAGRSVADLRRVAAATVSGRVAHRVFGTRIAVLDLPSGSDPLAAARALQRTAAIDVAEPNWIRHAAYIPLDPSFDQQWGLNNTGQSHLIADPPPANVNGLADADADVDLAWDTTTGDPGTIIAVIDTGIDLNHPDLADKVWVNTGETPSNGLDDDGNGYVDDLNGWDFVGDDANPNDTDGHGSHVSGIAAAGIDNGAGGAGVCPECTIMPLRAAGGQGFALGNTIDALNYAVDNGADIINMSYGGPQWSMLERDTLADVGAAGVLMVAAAGNEDRDNDALDWRVQGLPDGPSYPASYGMPQIVSVAASNDLDDYGYFTGCSIGGGNNACDFTNWGNASVDLAAPGVDIYSTVPDDTYDVYNGTSMASPFVAGVAGLVASLHPGYSPAQIKNALLNSADEPGSLGGGFSFTNGRVNADAALDASTASLGGAGDDVMQGATPITYKKTGSLNIPADRNDIFKMRLRAGRRYAVLVEVPPQRDFDLFVWKPGSLDTWPTNYGCGALSCLLLRAGLAGKGVDEYVKFTPKKTGTYYFHVNAFKGSGSYVIYVGLP